MAVNVSGDLETKRYALLLEWGTNVGLLLTVLLFCSYLGGFWELALQPDRVIAHWRLPLEDFYSAVVDAQAATEGGSSSLGDQVNLLGIKWLALCTVMPLAGVVRIYLKLPGGVVFAVIAVLEGGLLVASASGLMTFAH
jgi:hypothetical protein